MTTTVLKYPLILVDWQTLEMPIGAKPLCIQIHNGIPTMWCRVTVGASIIPTRFRIAYTGHELGPDVGKYVGTFQLDCGALVFHVFEEAHR